MAKALPRINKTIFQRENFRRLTWPAFEIYYNPNNMVQTGELTRGFMQQNRPSRNRPAHIWSIEFLTKLQGEFKEEMLKWGHAAAGDSESVSHSVTSDFLDCGPPHSSVHGILQARILEWVAISFSRGSSRPRDQTYVFWIAGVFSYHLATREAPSSSHYRAMKCRKEAIMSARSFIAWLKHKNSDK